MIRMVSNTIFSTRQKIGLCKTCKTEGGDFFTLIGEIVGHKVVNVKWYNKTDLNFVPEWTNGKSSPDLTKSVGKFLSRRIH